MFPSYASRIFASSSTSSNASASTTGSEPSSPDTDNMFRMTTNNTSSPPRSHGAPPTTSAPPPTSPTINVHSYNTSTSAATRRRFVPTSLSSHPSTQSLSQSLSSAHSHGSSGDETTHFQLAPLDESASAGTGLHHHGGQQLHDSGKKRGGGVTGNVSFSSLRETLVDRAATLFPSMLILTFGLLLVLHLLNPSSLQVLTHVYPMVPSSASSSSTGTATSAVGHFLSSSSFASSSNSINSDSSSSFSVESSLSSSPFSFSSSSSKTPAASRLSHPDLLSELTRWKDPSYAAARLRVFYYDLPTEFNSALVRDSHLHPPKIRDPFCDESFYSAEHTLAEHFRTSAVRTTDPNLADFFYVPVFTTCYLLTHLPNDVNRTGAFFSRAMDHVINEHPYWNRSDGRDHVFMFAQGFGARLSGDWTRYRHATFLVHNGDYSEPHFSTHKDVVVPPDLSHYLTPVGITSPDKLVKKRYFVLFGGQVLNASIADHRGSNYSGGVRQYVAASLANADGYRVTGVRSESYTDDMTKAVFCLAPHGWHKWSPRPAYAVLLGCIPVVVSEEQTLFLENLLDYERFSYWIRPKDIRLLDRKLRSISPAELVQRERDMRLIWPLFWYDREHGLAREAVMYSLFRKIGARRPERHFI